MRNPLSPSHEVMPAARSEREGAGTHISPKDRLQSAVLELCKADKVHRGTLTLKSWARGARFCLIPLCARQVHDCQMNLAEVAILSRDFPPDTAANSTRCIALCERHRIIYLEAYTDLEVKSGVWRAALHVVERVSCRRRDCFTV
jgi:hypothetical protein